MITFISIQQMMERWCNGISPTKEEVQDLRRYITLKKEMEDLHLRLQQDEDYNEVWKPFFDERRSRGVESFYKKAKQFLKMIGEKNEKTIIA